MKKTGLMFLLTISLSLLINFYSVAAIDRSEYNDLPADVPIENEDGLQLNSYYWNNFGYQVYGTPGDVKKVKDNEFDKGTNQWRYLGFTLDGNIFSNILFPDDYPRKPFEESNWLYKPWEWGFCEVNQWSINPEMKEIINGSIPYTVSNGRKFDGTTFGQPNEVTEIFGYALVLSPPRTNKDGAIRMWHID